MAKYKNARCQKKLTDYFLKLKALCQLYSQISRPEWNQVTTWSTSPISLIIQVKIPKTKLVVRGRTGLEAGLQAPSAIVLWVDHKDSSTGWWPCVKMSHRGLSISQNSLSGADRLSLWYKTTTKYCTYPLKIRSISFQDKKIMGTWFTCVSLFIVLRTSNMVKVTKEKSK